MNNAGSAHELYFLYELAKALAASIDLAEVTEYALDGACALLGAEQGFIYFKDDTDTLCVHAARELTEPANRRLIDRIGCRNDENLSKRCHRCHSMRRKTRPHSQYYVSIDGFTIGG